MSNIIVTGGNSGLGAFLVVALEADGHTVWPYDIEDGNCVIEPTINSIGGTLRLPVDFGDTLDVLINCAGVNHLDWLQELEESDWDRVMDTNAKGIYKMSQACLSYLSASKGAILNIVSSASHMPMRCSLAYNASKAAAHMMTLQMARELTKTHGITVFGISPNKLHGTAMSRQIEQRVCETRGWTPSFAAKYQADALLTGEETPPEAVADFITFLLSDKSRHVYLSGCVLPYGA